MMLLSVALTCALSDMPFPYSKLPEVLPQVEHSFYSYANRYGMEELCKKHNIKTIIELGSWYGSSTKHFASLVGTTGKVYAVDHWFGSLEHQIDADNYRLDNLYNQFLSNMIHANLQDIVVPIRNTTENAVVYFYKNQIKPDLIYIDASHDEFSVYRDLNYYFPLVKDKGIMCGDDWNWGDLGVQRAVSRFAQENNLDILLYGNWFWVLQAK